MKQKPPNEKDAWMNTGKDHEYLFGSSQKGQSCLQKLERILVRHHLWVNVNGKKTWRFVPPCSVHASGDLCTNGPHCPKSHRLPVDLKYKAEGNHMSGADARKAIDKIFLEAKK